MLATRPSLYTANPPQWRLSLQAAYVRCRALELAGRGCALGPRNVADGGEQVESPEDAGRREVAMMLAGFGLDGFEVDLAIHGLRMFNDNPDRVVEWFITGEAMAWKAAGMDSQQEQNRSGMNAAVDSHPDEVRRRQRKEQASNIAVMVGVPPKLCELALTMFDNQNAATGWLLDNGHRYVPGMSDAQMFELTGTDDSGAAITAPEGSQQDRDREVLESLDLLTGSAGRGGEASTERYVFEGEETSGGAEGRFSNDPMTMGDAERFGESVEHIRQMIQSGMPPREIRQVLHSRQQRPQQRQQQVFLELAEAELEPLDQADGVTGTEELAELQLTAVLTNPGEMVCAVSDQQVAMSLQRGERAVGRMQRAVLDLPTGYAQLADNRRVTVSTFDEERCSIVPMTTSGAVLRRYQRMLGVPLSRGDNTALYSLCMAMEESMARLAARTALIALALAYATDIDLTKMPTLDADDAVATEAGPDVDFFNQLVRLTGTSEALFSASGTGTGSVALGDSTVKPGDGVVVDSSGTVTLRHGVQVSATGLQPCGSIVIKGGVTVVPASGRQLTGAMMLFLKRRLRKEICRAATSAEARTPLTSILVGELTSNLLRVTSPELQGVSDLRCEFRESTHPLFSEAGYSDSVRIPGARAMWISFHPRCDIGETRLTFHIDDGSPNGREVQSCTGSVASGGFKPFVVHGDSVVFKLQVRVAFKARLCQR